ncbi:MAG: replicative DNA helicase [Thermoanaerobaculia bacterium]|nr:replicative DNA helicase [Thermoanaerobaculia bacterium]
MAFTPLTLAIDKPLPQNPEAERSVLGSILIDASSFYRVVGILHSEDFYRDGHRVIFTAIQNLAEQSREIDLLTVHEELSRTAQLELAGGAAYVSSLVNGIPDIANVERYARIVKDKSTLRRLALMGNQIMRSAMDAPGDPGEVLGAAEKNLYDIAEGSTDQGFTGLDKITRKNLGAIEQLQGAGKLITGIPTGYDRLNEMTSGFQRKDLVILAARPSMGKTSLMMNIAEAIAIPRPGDGEPMQNVGIFSLEMSKEQLGLRLLSSEAGVSTQLIRSGLLSKKNWDALAEASARLSKAKIWIDDSAAIDILEMRAKSRRLKMEHGLDMIMVDYLQLVHFRGRSESRNQEISQISRGLKALAKEMDAPVMALSQLSRRPEQRTGDHRPQLADLRESGAIEQDADLVMFIYRDEVYHKDSEEKGIAEIIIAKQRNGPIGDFKLVFRHELTKFFNYEPEPV